MSNAALSQSPAPTTGTAATQRPRSPHSLLTTTAQTHAQQTDQQAYCTYLTEQAQAQSDLLRTPSGLAAFTQPDTGLPTQLVAGATLSLSSLKKAGITLDAARKNCDLYRAATGVQQYLQYALPAIEKDALINRLTLIAQASQSVDDLIAQSTKMVDAQNMTRPMLLEPANDQNQARSRPRRYPVQDLRHLRPTARRRSPSKHQVADKQSTDSAEQRALEKLARQNNWDVALTVGAHQQINPVANSVQPYGEITATYNFASRVIDRHLDRSVEAYAGWKEVQEGDTVRGMEVLRTQVAQTIAAQQSRLLALQRESQQIDKNLQLVQTPDTTAAYDFRNQLTTTQILLTIETADSTYRLTHLQKLPNPKLLSVTTDPAWVFHPSQSHRDGWDVTVRTPALPALRGHWKREDFDHARQRPPSTPSPSLTHIGPRLYPQKVREGSPT